VLLEFGLILVLSSVLTISPGTKYRKVLFLLSSIMDEPNTHQEAGSGFDLVGEPFAVIESDPGACAWEKCRRQKLTAES
jgi:hypothetical protein